MAITAGANRQEVIELIGKIKTDSEDIKSTIQSKLQTGIIDAIKDAWYSEEAVKFFTAFEETVEAASKGIAEGVNTVINNIAATYDSWLDNTNPEGAASNHLRGSGEYTEVTEDETIVVLNIEGIRAVGPNTEIGIDENTASAVANNLPNIREDIQSVLSGMQQNIDATAALIDSTGSQSSAVRNFYNAQLTAIESIFSFLTEDTGDSKSLRTCINASVEKYGNISNVNASALNNAAGLN